MPCFRGERATKGDGRSSELRFPCPGGVSCSVARGYHPEEVQIKENVPGVCGIAAFRSETGGTGLSTVPSAAPRPPGGLGRTSAAPVPPAAPRRARPPAPPPPGPYLRRCRPASAAPGPSPDPAAPRGHPRSVRGCWGVGEGAAAGGRGGIKAAARRTKVLGGGCGGGARRCEWEISAGGASLARFPSCP